MAAEDSAKFLAATMEPLVLPDDVDPGVRSQSEKLKRLFCDGLFRYEGFTQAERESYRIIEVAVKARFLSHYQSRIPIDVAGVSHERPVTSFDDVFALVGKRRHSKAKRRGHPRFDGSLRALLTWARNERYLYGQRNRLREDATVRLRNHMQHSEHDTVLMPPDASRAIHYAFEIICRLWEYDPPASDSYPGLVPRTPWILGIGPQEGEATCFPLEPYFMDSDRQHEHRNWHVLLAIDNEDLLRWRPSGFELSRAAVDPLWGPGSWEELARYVQHRPEQWPTDHVDILDRFFYIRFRGDTVELPRSQGQLLALKDRTDDERWLVIRADSPLDALAHARHAKDGVRPKPGYCARSCASQPLWPWGVARPFRDSPDELVLFRALAAGPGRFWSTPCSAQVVHQPVNHGRQTLLGQPHGIRLPQIRVSKLAQ